jgi:hypothetical protein
VGTRGRPWLTLRTVSDGRRPSDPQRVSTTQDKVAGIQMPDSTVATGTRRHEAPATVLNSLMQVTRAAGKLGIPGLYVTGDPRAVDQDFDSGVAQKFVIDPHGLIPV